ncbi:dephospho-CoA kinase [Nitratireductor indicus]|uniref:Dephospho-CoA kinase n=1 Tax=Nitratireductor indicus C115 TaxID=1231190 RepID=K2N2U8_9HYPH|nr:dephospho-CoA kinase [Nitratireductor indicus]EKF41743.1 dephospho-CoA kinase [Nitratireductor indicus C115]MDS1136976.1 dephospho-CoA kinase [Nitratireductor indicus]SFQ67770.1 dephospho-CoA kinase [Nitratireductor indicus]
MIVLGLTGSIGMGKSTTAGMFVDEGVPVHDSDAAVHRLYAGAAAPLIEARFPGTVSDGVVDRTRLAAAVLSNPQAMKALEAIVHPLVRKDADDFVERNRAEGRPLVVLDIPLLFETGGMDRVDRIAVVTASAEEQRRRVLSRPGMTEEKFEAILARQVPDAEKRRRADFIIDTGNGMEPAREAVRNIIKALSPGEAQLG